MKWIIGLVALIPVLALAAGDAGQGPGTPEKPPAFGLSNNVIGHKSANDREDRVTKDTRRLLNEQAHSKPAEHSELSAPVYVETQQRLSRSFTRDIKDFGKEQTTGGATQ